MITRKTAVNVALAAGSLLFVMLLTEGALRLVLARGLNPFERHPTLGYTLERDFEGVYPRVRFRTDSLRRRVPADQVENASGRWLFLGDSVAFGFGVAAETAVPWLSTGRRGHRLLVDWLIERLPPPGERAAGAGEVP